MAALKANQSHHLLLVDKDHDCRQNIDYPEQDVQVGEQCQCLHFDVEGRHRLLQIDGEISLVRQVLLRVEIPQIDHPWKKLRVTFLIVGNYFERSSLILGQH